MCNQQIEQPVFKIQEYTVIVTFFIRLMNNDLVFLLIHIAFTRAQNRAKRMLLFQNTQNLTELSQYINDEILLSRSMTVFY